MGKIERLIAERWRKGSLPIAYDIFNKADLNETMCTLNTRSWNYGRAGAPIVFEEELDDE